MAVEMIKHLDEQEMIRRKILIERSEEKYL
jgi:hypothetical protein